MNIDAATPLVQKYIHNTKMCMIFVTNMKDSFL